MAATESKMIPLGSNLPKFRLLDVTTGKDVSSDEFYNGRPTLVMFLCNHCPYVKHIIEKLVETTNRYISEVNIVAINSNDYTRYPEDSPEKMVEYAQNYGYRFPYLIDETQEVAKTFGATCTPDFFLYDKESKLIYRGQFDDSRPGNDIPVTGADLQRALEYSISGKSIDFPQKPSVGCSIKWKS